MRERLYWGALRLRYAGGGGVRPPALRDAIDRWRSDFREALEGRLDVALSWDEDSESFGEVDLGPFGLKALRLWALYAARPDLELPDSTPPALELDRHWRVAAEGDFAGSHFGQLLVPTAWLPGEFEFTCQHPLPDGREVEFGSLVVLREQLQRLNQRTFQAGAEALLAWQELPADTAELIPAARRGLARASRAAADALDNGLPLLTLGDP